VAGVVAGALLGAGAGAMLGRAVDEASTQGIPKDDIFVFEEALRRGRTVVVIVAGDDAQAQLARDVLAEHGAVEAHAARNEWWSGPRDARSPERRDAA